MNELVTEPKTQAMTPANLLTIAVQQGADLDRLEKLMELQERWEKNEARKAFVAAMGAFKKNPPDIQKTKHVKYGQTEYHHAKLDHLVEHIGAGLSAHGLSHRWDVQQNEGLIRVTCVITHLLGHSELTTMQSGADSSGGKNSIQAISSAVSYLQRYTLLAATGLAARDMDDDGKGAVECISEKQVADLTAMITEIGVNKTSFLTFLGVESLELLPAAEYSKAVQALEGKRKKAKA